MPEVTQNNKKKKNMPEVNRTTAGQYLMADKITTDRTPVRTIGVTNSSRWTDLETRHLLEIWKKRYPSLKLKKRNFKDWEMIARELNVRCQVGSSTSLGPRTGAQCKIRIKNIVSDYKRTKGEAQGQNNKHTLPFFAIIDNILTGYDQQSSCQINGELDEQEAKQDQDIILQFPEEGHGMAKEEVSLGSTTGTPTVADMVLSTVDSPGSHPGTCRVPSTTAHNSGIEAQFHTTSHNQGSSSCHRLQASDRPLKRPRLQTKKLRKNQRPVKVVKVTKKVNKEDKFLTVVREFMEERRKREEELFDKLFAQQAEAEKRYQEFTLNVIREIGRLFRPEVFGSVS